jgi:hypothetical protein
MTNLQINLSGPDGSIYAVIGIVARKLQDVSGRPARNSFTTGALNCANYDAVLDYAVEVCKQYDVELTFKNRGSKTL